MESKVSLISEFIEISGVIFEIFVNVRKLRFLIRFFRSFQDAILHPSK